MQKNSKSLFIFDKIEYERSSRSKQLFEMKFVKIHRMFRKITSK